MKPHFVEVANVDRFLAGCQKVEDRGAPEKSWHLVTGQPGFGKTRTLNWHSIQTNVIHVRALSGWTYNWALKDLVRALDLEPQHSSEKNYHQIVEALVTLQIPIVVDEIEHAIASAKVIDMFRDISDDTFVPIIIGGMVGVEKKLKRFPATYDRISAITHFHACDLSDVHKCCDELCEIDVAEDVAPIVLEHTGGQLREIVNYLAELERIGMRQGGSICAADLQGKILTSDGKKRPRKLAQVA